MENFICDTKINIKHKITCRICFCIALPDKGFPSGKKAPPKRGFKLGKAYFCRLSTTWLALPSERLREKAGRKTIRELMPM